MKGIKNEKREIEALPLNLELKYDWMTEEEGRILRTHGRMRRGISRQILIPSDMSLHNLHYAIQRLFGWQNSHLHSFVLPEADYMRLTGGTMKGWVDLTGILFRASDGDGNEYYWDDNYRKGSFKKWLQEKYRWPYEDGAEAETFTVAHKHGQRLFQQVTELCSGVPEEELTLEEVNDQMYIEDGTESLLERLPVADVLVPHSTMLKPTSDIKQMCCAEAIAHELIYRYDYGDGWKIRIQRMEHTEDLKKCNDAIEAGELLQASEIVKKEHRPVCVGQDGMFLLDDVGGLSGFADMLKILYEGDDAEEAADYKAWALGQGWNGRRVSNRMVL